MSTLREVAALAGVSTATVSRVFSRPDAVSPETRERVLTAARELAYEPNLAARSLALGRTGNLGLFVPDIKNPVYTAGINSAQRHAQENGFALFLAAGYNEPDKDLALVQALARQVDGLVLIAPWISEEELLSVTKLTSLVLVNRIWGDMPAVLTPSADGMFQAVSHLADIGHRSITYLGGPEHMYTQASRLEAFQDTCTRLGLDGIALGPFEPDFAAAGEDIADRLVDQGVEAAIAYNDQLAIGLMKGLARRGWRAGREMSLIGFDDSWLADMCNPPLTTVHMPFAAVGRSAVQLLLDKLSGRTLGEESRVELTTRLVVRSSTRILPPDTAG